MILNCPRCGFSQPEDQYCAQCGVNMQSFRPAKKSFGKKLSENITLQVFVLVIIAGFGGSYMFQAGSSPKWMQKITRSQGVSKSTKTVSTVASSDDQVADFSSSSKADSTEQNLQALKDKEIVIEKSSVVTAAAVVESAPNAARATETNAKDAGSDSSAVNFKLTYAEVSVDVLARWVAESSRLGLFQNLQDYSAGILPDYKKRKYPLHEILKSYEKKLPIGQSEMFLSGIVGDDGQMIGLNAAVEMKSLEAGIVHGSLTITRAARAGRETYPADFELSKGAAFFIVDTINRQSFAAEKESLTMAPFQVFKSVEFMGQKTKFVIVLEPDI